MSKCYEDDNNSNISYHNHHTHHDHSHHHPPAIYAITMSLLHVQKCWYVSMIRKSSYSKRSHNMFVHTLQVVFVSELRIMTSQQIYNMETEGEETWNIWTPTINTIIDKVSPLIKWCQLTKKHRESCPKKVIHHIWQIDSKMFKLRQHRRKRVFSSSVASMNCCLSTHFRVSSCSLEIIYAGANRLRRQSESCKTTRERAICLRYSLTEVKWVISGDLCRAGGGPWGRMPRKDNTTHRSWARDWSR